MNPTLAPGSVPMVPQGLLVGLPHMAAPGVVPPSVPAATAVPDAPPNHTIYVNNLNEKIRRDELKKSLYAVFVQFGSIVDIITGKAMKMRGQAFVVFDDINGAGTAMRSMQGFPLYEKPMRIQFAKRDSDVIAKRKGTYVERKKTAHRVVADAVQAAVAAVGTAIDAASGPQGGTSARAIRRRQQRAAAAAALAAQNQVANGNAVPPPPSLDAPIHPAPPPVPINPASIPDQPPNKILFATNLPDNCDESMLSILFNRFAGYREVRMVPGRHDIAFVEFSTEMEAGIAKQGLQGFNICPGKSIRITFAKK